MDTAVAPDRAAPHRAAPDRLDKRRADALRREELASFLRSRRERIAPEQVGLPAGGRRRTPGLRREEVAQLAGVGVTWYTWLEQGRDIHVSEQVLEAVSRSLLLEPQEQLHLYTLAGAPRPTVRAECAALGPSAAVLLAQMEPIPAAFQNTRYDILAYNRTYARLVRNLDEVELEDRNLIWLAFTDPAWREVLVDWDDAVARMTAQLRSAYAENVGDPAIKSLLRRLRAASPEFCALWDQHEVTVPETKGKRFLNPDVGLLRLDHTNLWCAPRASTRMVVYVPSDGVSAERLDRLYAIVKADEAASDAVAMTADMVATA